MSTNNTDTSPDNITAQHNTSTTSSAVSQQPIIITPTTTHNNNSIDNDPIIDPQPLTTRPNKNKVNNKITPIKKPNNKTNQSDITTDTTTSRSLIDPLTHPNADEIIEAFNGKVIFPYEVDDITFLKATVDERKVIIEKRNELIRYYHVLGHFNYQKMSLRMLFDGYAWRKMLTHCQDYCLSCPTCIKYNQQKTEHVPRSPFISSEPFEFVQMDVFGPIYSKLFDDTQTKRYCLAIIDILSGFINLYPMSDTKETTIAANLLRFCSQFGAPRLWQSDNASYFKTEDLHV